jgi:5-methylcytosine-specific restriction endonuclease McrA
MAANPDSNPKPTTEQDATVYVDLVGLSISDADFQIIMDDLQAARDQMEHAKFCAEIAYHDAVSAMLNQRGYDGRRAIVTLLYWAKDKVFQNTEIISMARMTVDPQLLCRSLLPVYTLANCERCGATVRVTHSSRAKYQGWKSWRTVHCPACEQELKAEHRAYWDERREAEKATGHQIATLRSMPYSEYLQTDHWKAVRTQALARAHYRCQVCNSTGRLDVHHRTYDRRGQELPEDLIVLCRSCHETFHQNGRLAR